MLLMLVGLIGSILPWIPGAVLIFAGAVLHYLFLGSENRTATIMLIVLGVLMMLALAVDLLSGSVGAKMFGSTRWGALGGIVGAVVGMFFGLIGAFVGPIVGVLIGELLAGRGILPAGRSTWGTLLGTTAGMIGKVGIALVMVVSFFISLLF